MDFTTQNKCGCNILKKESKTEASLFSKTSNWFQIGRYKMKLFLWNDRDWKLVDETNISDYNAETYTVARKLLVRWNCSDTDHHFVSHSIREVFEPFGEVTSVKLTNDSEFFDEECEALVTFLHSESAFNVLVAEHNGSFISERLLSVMPADTAQQSDLHELEQMDTYDGSDDAPEIVEVTHGLKDLSLSPQIPCDSNDLTFEINLGPGLNMKQIHKLIFEIEPFQNHLVLDYDCLAAEENDSDEDDILWSIDKTGFEKRATETIAKLCAKYFKKLTIRGKVEISIEMLEWLRPLLKGLNFLNIGTFTNGRLVYALKEYCPKLKKLQFHTCKWKGADMMSGFVSKPSAWPSLTALRLKYVELSIESHTENGAKFQQFIELNPQLEELQLEPVVDSAMLIKIATGLPNLRSLAITRRDCSDLGIVINSISSLKQLTSIQVTTLIANNLQFVSSFVQQFSLLELVVLIQKYEPSISEEEQFEQFIDLPVTHHNGCYCNGAERSLSFEDCIDVVAIPKDQPVIVLVTSMNSYDEPKVTEVSDMIEDSRKFYPNIIKQETVQGKDHQTFICICSG